MNQRIIYPTDDGGVAVIVQAPGATLEQVLQAVPAGRPYKLVEGMMFPQLYLQKLHQQRLHRH